MKKFLCEDLSVHMGISLLQARFLIKVLSTEGALTSERVPESTGKRGRPKKFYKSTLKAQEFFAKLQLFLETGND